MEKINLKCEGMDYSSEILNNKDTIRRFEQTYKVLKKQLPEKIGKVLCMGPENRFDKKICEYFEAEYNYMPDDLNETWDFFTFNKKYDYIFCFEVMEHILNPLLFLRMCSIMECPIVLTYPRHPFVPLWGPRHFHEYSERAFYTLLCEAGFKIQYHTSFTNRNSLFRFPKSFRKLMQRIFVLFGYPKTELYIVT